jgi:ABC-type methionine transport system permease subunit
MASNPSKATRYVFLIAGILLLGASGMGLWFHGKDAMKLWQLQHAPPPAKGKTVPAQPPTEAVMKIYSYVAGEIIGLFLGIGLILKSAQKEKTGSGETVEGSEPAIEAEPAHKPKPVAAPRRWQTCNILEPGLDKRRLWSFVAGKSGFTLVQQQNVAIKDPLPVKEVGRDWKNLLQPKLNIAWLPTGQVFLRVLQLPVGELDEMMSMVELQLEKISPIPVTQIVWTAEVLPQKKDNLQTVVVVIVLTYWAWYARIIRGEVMALKSRDYIAFARVAGVGTLTILWRHLLPNIFNTLVVLATLQVGQVILFEASLSFLGLGIQQPDVSWGLMLSDARQYITNAWWAITMPGIAIMLTCLAANVFGDWLRDRLDPQLRQL